jgi:hypothetical protein
MTIQIQWSTPRRGISFSTGAFFRRFSIVATTRGYTVSDHEQHDQARTITIQAARAWAGIRVGETIVHRAPINALAQRV